MTMDTKQIEYMLMIAEENNITRAAQKLFITQPALNLQLLRLEKELGTQLFHRSRTDWRPTEAGEVYLKNARKMLQIKQETYRIIGDMVEDKKGQLSVGFTPGRGSSMFSVVYPRFHSEYPEITVSPRELSVRTQQKLIANGELDIGFMTLRDSQRTSDSYIPIADEEIFLVLPAGHPLSAHSSQMPKDGRYPTLDIAAVQSEPFVLMYRESTIRQMVDSLFEEAGFTPNVLFETSNTSTILTMIRSRLCCGLIPAYYLRDQPEGVACFCLPSHPTWEITASHRKNSYLTHSASRFVELAAEYWRSERP